MYDASDYALARWRDRPEKGAGRKIDLASATGLPWRLRDLGALDELADLPLRYGESVGAAELRCSIADFLGLVASRICVTSGASEALLLAMIAAKRSGGSVLLPRPGYPAVPMMARALGLSPAFYSLSTGNGFWQRPAAILAQVKASTCLVVVNTPNNPTGAEMEADDLIRLAASLERLDIPLVIDEVFQPFAKPPLSWATITPYAWTIGDLSKPFSLPGLRIGWISTADERLVGKIAGQRAWLSASGSPLLEILASRAFACAEKLIAPARHAIAENRRVLHKVLRISHRLALPPGVSEGPVTLVRVLSGDADGFCRALERRGVIALPGSIFGASECFRVGLAGDEAEFRSAVRIMAEIL